MEASDVKEGMEEERKAETETVKQPKPKKAKPSKAPPKKSTKPRRRTVAKSSSSKKVGTAVSVTVMDQIRRLRAKLELQSGKRTTISDAVGYAVAKALK